MEHFLDIAGHFRILPYVLIITALVIKNKKPEAYRSITALRRRKDNRHMIVVGACALILSLIPPFLGSSFHFSTVFETFFNLFLLSISPIMIYQQILMLGLKKRKLRDNR